jgi:hypothetical protein
MAHSSWVTCRFAMDSGTSKSDDGQTQTVIAGWEKHGQVYAQYNLVRSRSLWQRFPAMIQVAASYPLLSYQGNFIFKVISLVIYPLYIFLTKSNKHNGLLLVYLRWLKVWSTQGYLSQSNIEQHQDNNNRICDWLFMTLQSSWFVYDCGFLIAKTSAWKSIVYLGR